MLAKGNHFSTGPIVSGWGCRGRGRYITTERGHTEEGGGGGGGRRSDGGDGGSWSGGGGSGVMNNVNVEQVE